MESQTVVENTPASARVDADRALGGFYGLALGDALGMPHEFRSSVPVDHYTGRLEFQTRISRRFLSPIVLPIGHVSDNTEMALALAGALNQLPAHETTEQDLEDNALESTPESSLIASAYTNWAATRPPFAGRKTRALFFGANTNDDFCARHNSIFSSEEEREAAQSNGALMRCFPIALLPRESAVSITEIDARLTNPSSICIAINVFFVGLLREAVRGASPAAVWAQARDKTHHGHPVVSGIVAAVVAREKWDLVCDAIAARTAASAKTEPNAALLVSDFSHVCAHEGCTRLLPLAMRQSKGWVGCGLYAALWCLRELAEGPVGVPPTTPPSFGDLIRWVIVNHPRSDTATNAAIAGMLIGALVGFAEMRADPVICENLSALANLADDDLRPRRYTTAAINEACAALAIRESCALAVRENSARAAREDTPPAVEENETLDASEL